jgi:hypothetical protein
MIDEQRLDELAAKGHRIHEDWAPLAFEARDTDLLVRFDTITLRVDEVDGDARFGIVVPDEVRHAVALRWLPLYQPQAAMAAVLAASARVHDGRWIKGAPTHVLADLLNELRAEGWELRRMDPSEREMYAAAETSTT